MRRPLSSFVLCTLVASTLLGLTADSAVASVTVRTSRGRTDSASWTVISPEGCEQLVNVQVFTLRTMEIDTANRTVVRVRENPALLFSVSQFGTDACADDTASTLIENLTPQQYSSSGLNSASLNINDVVVQGSGSLGGSFDLALQWRGQGPASSTPTRLRFCDEFGCVSIVGNSVRRNATVSGTVVLDGTDDHSPSVAVGPVTASIEKAGDVTISRP